MSWYQVDVTSVPIGQLVNLQPQESLGETN